MSPGGENTCQKAEMLKAVASLLTPIVVATLGIYGSGFLERRQELDAKTRLYAELMSNREMADSEVRKDMFNSIIPIFLKVEGQGDADSQRRRIERVEQEILALELLAYNFHESLDLGPLFKEALRNVTAIAGQGEAGVDLIGPRKTEETFGRLEKLAKEVIGKQVDILAEAGGKLDGSFNTEELEAHPEGLRVINDDLAIVAGAAGQASEPIHQRRFTVYVLDIDPKKKEVRIELRVRPQTQPTAETEFQKVFWINFFDFPMIDNTRLSNGDRCSVVLKDFDEYGGEIVLVYFPSSRSGLKEKPYYDELINEVLKRD